MVHLSKRGRVWIAHYVWSDPVEPGWGVQQTNLIRNQSGNWVMTGGVRPTAAAEKKMLEEVRHEWQKLLMNLMLEDGDVHSSPQGGTVSSS